MRRFLVFLAVLGSAGVLTLAATPVWVTPDVPTDETLSGFTLLPSEIYKYDGGSYTLALSVPGAPDLDAIHKMDTFGDWLLSVEAASDLGGTLLPAGSVADPRDVIWFDSATGAYSICMSGALAGIPVGSNVDAVFMDVKDDGDIIVSFDVPTDIPPFTGTTAFEPGDLVRFVPLGPGKCPGAGFAIAAANPVVDASLTVPPIPLSSNVYGAEDGSSKWIVAFDVPTDLPPFAGPAAFVPGDLVAWSGAAYSSFEALSGWPISGIVDGVTCGGSPGRIPTTMLVTKAASPNITLSWSASCLTDGGQDYGIYEGILGSYYSHALKVCTDSAPALSETITPAGVNHYYLVVPINTCKPAEGSYGRCSTVAACGPGNERPIGAPTCAVRRLPFPGDPACP